MYFLIQKFALSRMYTHALEYKFAKKKRSYATFVTVQYLMEAF